MSNETEIKVTIDRLGRRVSETGEEKRSVYTERVNEEGTICRTTENEKGVNDCGHAGETGGVCSVCGAFAICRDCASDGRFACSVCKRQVCSRCARQSVLNAGVRVCRRCGLRGIMRASLARRP
jgi:hypothetical protein